MMISRSKSTNYVVCPIFGSWIYFCHDIIRKKSRRERKVSFLPFESYVKAFGQGNVEIQLQIIMNVLMFVLLGAMLPLCFKHFEKNKEVVLTAFMISILIETTQGVMHIGMFEWMICWKLYWERKLVLGLIILSHRLKKQQEEVIFPWNLPYCIEKFFVLE